MSILYPKSFAQLKGRIYEDSYLNLFLTYHTTSNKKIKTQNIHNFSIQKYYLYTFPSPCKKSQNITAGCLLPLDLAGAVLVLDLLALGHARVPVRFAVGAADGSA